MFRRIYNHLRGNGLPPLGRWCLKDKSKNDWKIDSANTDHCGTCSYEQPVPLPEGEMLMFANTPFKPECCPNTYSNSSGCACMTGNQYNYLITRGSNNVPYSEY